MKNCNVGMLLACAIVNGLFVVVCIDMKFPSISVAAAQWLVDNRAIYAVGIDTTSIEWEPGNECCAMNQIYHISCAKCLL